MLSDSVSFSVVRQGSRRVWTNTGKIISKSVFGEKIISFASEHFGSLEKYEVHIANGKSVHSREILGGGIKPG